MVFHTECSWYIVIIGGTCPVISFNLVPFDFPSVGGWVHWGWGFCQGSFVWDLVWWFILFFSFQIPWQKSTVRKAQSSPRSQMWFVGVISANRNFHWLVIKQLGINRLLCYYGIKSCVNEFVLCECRLVFHHLQMVLGKVILFTSLTIL